MTTIETAVEKFTDRLQRTTPKDFLSAWNISHSIVALRLRAIGVDISSDEVKTLVNLKKVTAQQEYTLLMIMLEIQKDIKQTLNFA